MRDLTMHELESCVFFGAGERLPQAVVRAFGPPHLEMDNREMPALARWAGARSSLRGTTSGYVLCILHGPPTRTMTRELAIWAREHERGLLPPCVVVLCDGIPDRELAGAFTCFGAAS